MKRLTLIFTMLIAIGLSGTLASAHEGNEHVRGTITEISAHAITVKTAATKTTTLTLDDKTVFQKSGVKAKAQDLKVGDRVVVDVPEHTTLAKLVQFGPPAKK